MKILPKWYTFQVETGPFFNYYIHYKWTKDFVEAGKKRLSGDELREATSDEVKEIRKENTLLKESLADLVIRYDIVKKSLDLLD